MATKILMVGSGVVGEATGTALAEHGFDVTFSDSNAGVVERLKANGRRAFQVSEVKKPDVDVYVVAVPTYPLDICRDEAAAEKLERAMSPLQWCEMGIDFIRSASISLGQWLSRADRYQVVAIRSAVLPGTTEQMVIPTIQQQSGRVAGRDFGVCINPEYLREKRALDDIRNPWITCIGELDKRSGDVLVELYRWAACPLFRVSIRAAEMQKFAHNLFNATKISFFNEMRLVCERIGVDADSIFPIVARSAEALWNPEYGTKDYGPFGGRCLPKDTVAFLAWAKKAGMQPRMIEAAIEVNQVFEKRLEAMSTAGL